MGQNFSYKAGKGASEPFKTSGKPYLYRSRWVDSGSVEEDIIVLPSIAKSIMLISESDNITGSVVRLHFSTRTGDTDVVDANGLGHNVPLGPGEFVTLDVKCKTVYISRDASPGGTVYYRFVAELTGIQGECEVSGDGIDA